MRNKLIKNALYVRNGMIRIWLDLLQVQLLDTWNIGSIRFVSNETSMFQNMMTLTKESAGWFKSWSLMENNLVADVGKTEQQSSVKPAKLGIMETFALKSFWLETLNKKLSVWNVWLKTFIMRLQQQRRINLSKSFGIEMIRVFTRTILEKTLKHSQLKKTWKESSMARSEISVIWFGRDMSKV